VADNDGKMADSGEGYKEKDDRPDGMKTVKREAPEANAVEKP
jgi:uncharacterized protein YegP (UPF0339 family)